MGGDSVGVALEVLAGAPVPKIYESTRLIASKGDETPSIRPEVGRGYGRWTSPATDPLTGLGPDYDPTTFSVDYPQ